MPSLRGRWGSSAGDLLAAVAGDGFHPVLEKELFLLQALLFHFLVDGQTGLLGQLVKPFLVVAVLLAKAAKLRVGHGELVAVFHRVKPPCLFVTEKSARRVTVLV